MNRVENHIYGDHSVEFMSSLTFRKPFVIGAFDLVEGVSDKLRFYDAIVCEPRGNRLVQAADIVLHVDPDSEAARNLINVQLSPLLFDTYADNRGTELVSIELRPHVGSATVLSNGALTRTVRHAHDYEFRFTFCW
ncbi:hypothetical protein [Paraburkholderia hospita]|uniref:Uncharacterized protein n=1 Tax=Paraburkholderia hospita TaxID=169430 RepID=A0AAN1MNV8_9BURK|nr:hypothetical protein [Paraburkholderia hospita]AUT74048.1 hypothetical protein C2L64_37765 [Paraburkholderia hospita]EIN02958.1 hypothetical protein WQE_01010 [Paraburkholderia hospita]OUL78682.1 hypothetical protein CA602_31050 [Paraburkholderia hospita]OUL85887.1 hypothetical protein CA601_23045 [Paraburkholderia hospita]SEH45377.1 hypothetical protein SAMN05192544_100235 [Paraburkholderia hospita]